MAGSKIIAVIGIVFILICLSVTVPMIQGMYRTNMESALSYWDSLGYVAFADVEGNVLPLTDDTADIGTEDLRFKDAYFSGSVNADAVNAPTGRTATYVIAASDSPAHVKAQADYVCDGTADNVEINTYLALGDVRLSTGTFTTANGQSILVPSGRTLEGSGWGTIVTTASGASGAPVIINSDPVSGNEKIVVRNLAVNGNQSGVGAYTPCITLDNVDNGLIESCWVDNAHTEGVTNRGQGIAILGGSTNITIQGNYATANGLAGISVRNSCQNIQIINNYVWGNAEEGIVVGTEGADSGEGSNVIIIDGNVVWNNSQVANSTEIIVQDQATGAPGNPMTKYIITNNQVDAEYYGITLSSKYSTPADSYSVISNNIITGDGSIASILVVENMRYVSVLGNMVKDGTIEIFGSPDATVESNHISALTDGIAILVRGASPRANVTGNIISVIGSGGPVGIYCNDTSNDSLLNNNIITMLQSTGTPAGRAISVNADRCSIQNNRIISTTPSSGIGIGIKVDTTADQTLVQGNNLINGYRAVAMSISGTNTTVRNNLGYIAPGEIRTYSQSLADDASLALETGKAGFGKVIFGDSVEYSDFYFKADGTVTLVNNTTNVVNTDTDNKYCVIDAGSGVEIKNRSGGSLTVTVQVCYQ